jgi:hypothetical protein
MTGTPDSKMNAHRKEQRLENIKFLLDSGEHWTHVAKRVGLSPSAFIKEVERSGLGITDTRAR